MKRWGWIAFGGAPGAVFVAGRRRPLRRATERGVERVARNAVIGLLAGATTAASEMPIVAPVQRLAERGRMGLARQLPLARALPMSLQILLLGVDRATLRLWQQMLVVSVIFHHSNLELSEPLESWLNAVVVTP